LDSDGIVIRATPFLSLIHQANFLLEDWGIGYRTGTQFIGEGGYSHQPITRGLQVYC
jgi:hypothetical protein